MVPEIVDKHTRYSRAEALQRLQNSKDKSHKITEGAGEQGGIHTKKRNPAINTQMHPILIKQHPGINLIHKLICIITKSFITNSTASIF